MKCCDDKITCPVNATIGIIGGKYKSLILWHLLNKTLRFSEIKKLIPAATPKMLTQQLRELEHDNLVIRTVYPVVPPKVEYHLSEYGQSIKSILVSMYEWGEAYLKDNGKVANCSMVNQVSNETKIQAALLEAGDISKEKNDIVLDNINQHKNQ